MIYRGKVRGGVVVLQAGIQLPEELDAGFRPPRCLPAWSRVQNQSSTRPATASATTLLASVEPCSRPAVVPITLRPAP